MVGDRQRARLRAGLAFAQRELARGHGHHAADGVVDVEHAGTLAMHRLEEPQPRVGRPDLRIGGVLHQRTDVASLGAWPGLEQQRHRAGHVRCGHRRAAEHGVLAGLDRVGRVDTAARRAHVGLERQVRRQAVGAEAGDQVGRRIRERTLLVGPDHRHRCGLRHDELAVGLRDAHHRNVGAERRAQRAVYDARRVVVDHHCRSAGIDGLDRLLGERAGAAHDQRRLAARVAGQGIDVAGTSDVDDLVDPEVGAGAEKVIVR